MTIALAATITLLIAFGLKLFQLDRRVEALESRIGPKTESLGIFGEHTKSSLGDDE